MAESTEPTFEIAKRCPRCEQPGQEVETRRQRDGSKLHTFMCRNARCRWNNTTYVVQVNSDGSIPPPNTHRPKTFPALPNRDQEKIDEANLRMLENQMRTGTEIR